MVQRILAGLLIVVGLTMAGGLLSVADRHQVGAMVGAFLISSIAPVGAGVWLWRRTRRRELAQQQSAERAEERRLLQLAKAHGGHLTVAEVFTLAGIDMARAEQLLEGLCQQGLAEHRVADDGTMVYRLQPLLSAAEKQKARGVLERD